MKKIKYKFLLFLSSCLKKITDFNRFYDNEILKSGLKSVGQNMNIMEGYYITGRNYIEIGDDFTVGRRLRMEAITEYQNQKFVPKLKIGNNVNINFNVHIACCDSVEIKDNVLMASNVFITDHFHGDTTLTSLKDIPKNRALKTGPVFIGQNVLIGQNVTILPNVKIGDNCIIGANSVVTKSFHSNSVIAGIPAKLLKTINE